MSTAKDHSEENHGERHYQRHRSVSGGSQKDKRATISQTPYDESCLAYAYDQCLADATSFPSSNNIPCHEPCEISSRKRSSKWDGDR